MSRRRRGTPASVPALLLLLAFGAVGALLSVLPRTFEARPLLTCPTV